jgi:hypothetical protein
MPGARCARSRAWCVVSTRVSHHGHAGIPGIPRAMVLTVSFVLSSVTGLVCHRHRRNDFQQLDTSVGVSGPHDFAVRFSAIRQRRIHVHRISRPTFCDDRETPLLRAEDARKHAGDLPDVTSESAAANWHDGQITRGGAYQNTGVKNQGKNPSFSVLDVCLLWRAFRTQIRHRERSEKCQQATSRR